MTKPDWCPQGVWDEAFHHMDCHASQAMLGDDDLQHSVHVAIARALLEAERRGMERAAEIATERLCPDTAKAIRAAAKEIEP